MRFIKARQGQSIADIALEQYGDVEGVYMIAEDNNLNGIVDNLAEGQALRIRDEYINKPVALRMQEVGIATLQVDADRGSGIGWWQIGNDFVIQ